MYVCITLNVDKYKDKKDIILLTPDILNYCLFSYESALPPFILSLSYSWGTMGWKWGLNEWLRKEERKGDEKKKRKGSDRKRWR